MIVIGIESSCDETSVSLVTDKKVILSNVIYSQIDMHKEFGGVVPEIAARAHLEHISSVFDKAMLEAGISKAEIDAVAATCGPGLIGGVVVGASFGKGLAISLRKPFIPVNHLMAHALTPRLTNELDYPYLLMLASGGHCFISEILSPSDTNTLGGTIDDSAGECFDKVAKMLSIEYPGGPKIEKLAKSGDPMSFQLPMPLCSQKNCDFSFSGLKTSIKYLIQKSKDDITAEHKADLCASFQRTVSEIFINRLRNAIKIMNPKIKSLAFAGGVSANQYINSRMKEFAHSNGLNFFNSPIRLCTDNGAMVAWCGIEQLPCESYIGCDLHPTWKLK